MSMTNSKPTTTGLSTPLLLLVLLLLLIGVLFTALPKPSISSAAIEASQSIHLDHNTIHISSPTLEHHALQNSEFVLELTSNSDAAQPDAPKLINPTIQLEMLHMNCGIVTSRAEADTPFLYSTSAAPLMKGVWVATAAFQLEGYGDDVFQLQYTFEVL